MRPFSSIIVLWVFSTWLLLETERDVEYFKSHSSIINPPNVVDCSIDVEIEMKPFSSIINLLVFYGLLYRC